MREAVDVTVGVAVTKAVRELVRVPVIVPVIDFVLEGVAVMNPVGLRVDVCVCVIEKDGVLVLLGVIVADMVADVVLVSVLVCLRT